MDYWTGPALRVFQAGPFPEARWIEVSITKTGIRPSR